MHWLYGQLKILKSYLTNFDRQSQLKKSLKKLRKTIKVHLKTVKRTQKKLSVIVKIKRYVQKVNFFLEGLNNKIITFPDLKFKSFKFKICKTVLN
jgi:nitrate/nitrite-specific signal transduction histidine kinase